MPDMQQEASHKVSRQSSSSSFPEPTLEQLNSDYAEIAELMEVSMARCVILNKVANDRDRFRRVALNLLRGARPGIGKSNQVEIGGSDILQSSRELTSLFPRSSPFSRQTTKQTVPLLLPDSKQTKS